MDTSPKMYIDNCRMYINFMISTGHWAALGRKSIYTWINNYSDCSLEEIALAYKLLVNMIYFSENEIINVVSEGLNKLFHRHIVEAQLSNDFKLSQKTLINIVNEHKSKTLFIPLLDSASPHESSNYILRLMVTNHLISPTQSVFPDETTSLLSSGKYTSLVIVDDCVGSGEQINDFWNNYVLPGNILLRDYCESNNIDVTYLTLFGYKQSISTLKKAYPALKILCVRDLIDNQRAFDKSSYIWENDNERQKAFNLFKEIADINSIPLYGFNNLDFVFAMHKTIPDWSLPILWKERSDWQPLLRRKNSHV